MERNGDIHTAEVDLDRQIGSTLEPTASRPTDGFPFARRLDFTPLLEFCEKLAREDDGFGIASADQIRREMESVPGLLGPIDDLELVQRNMPIVARLLGVVIPPAFRDRSYMAAFVPFRYQMIHATPRFMSVVMDSRGASIGSFGLDSAAMEERKILRGYLIVAAHFYGLAFDFAEPMVATVIDATTGLERHFRLDIDIRFIRLEQVGELPALGPEQIAELRENITDLTLWRRLIPDGSFEFRGVAIINAVDVTDQEVLSRLKHRLVDSNAFSAGASFLDIQQRVRELLRRPDISMALAAFDGDDVLLMNDGTRFESDCMRGFSERHEKSEFTGTIFERALQSGRIQVVDDLAAIKEPTDLERKFLKKGMRNLFVVPLYYDHQMIGALNFASPNPSDLTVLTELVLREITPLFAMALRRNREELDNRMQAIVREQYTAIHPSVEWRFRRAAYRLLLRESRGEPAEVEQIIFDGVYPLYSVSDLRGSSLQRNSAIRADLLEHLRLALDVIHAAADARPLPVFDNIAYRISTAMSRLEDGIASGDETTILDFLRREIEPLFDHLGGMNPEVTEQVIRYRSAIDPELGIIYRKRKEFEQSVALVNRTIAAYLEEEQDRAQKMFPHYFEKHQTDGVDFGMYVGASLVENGEFDLLYLKNLRLWQLMTMCGIARRTAALRSQLAVPLDTTHLILVQNTPLSIRFRLDEKQFDVDGAYNVRYEIMKKRIDKALVKGTTERLTQPETIAIVYSNAREAVEYREYIEYLQSTGHLHPEIESLELEELQEVQGLKALRVRVRVRDEG